MDQKRKSSLFPNRQRPKNNGLENIATFSEELANTPEVTQQPLSKKNMQLSPESKKIKYPTKSHKGIAGRKTEYLDPRLKKEYNAKISLSTKVRIERLISRKFDGKSMGDVIDLALDNLVLNFDRDDRDSLYKSYREDMELLIPIIEEKNRVLRERGKSTIELTNEINEQTLEQQKEAWVDRKI